MEVEVGAIGSGSYPEVKNYLAESYHSKMSQEKAFELLAQAFNQALKMDAQTTRLLKGYRASILTNRGLEPLPVGWRDSRDAVSFIHPESS